jgi:hypothetical protein
LRGQVNQIIEEDQEKMIKIYSLIREKVKSQGDFTEIKKEINEVHRQLINNVKILINKDENI